jgi:hypothetical protein
MRPRISQTHAAADEVDGPIEFRAVIDALIEEEDRRQGDSLKTVTENGY